MTLNILTTNGVINATFVVDLLYVLLFFCVSFALSTYFRDAYMFKNEKKSFQLLWTLRADSLSKPVIIHGRY